MKTKTKKTSKPSIHNARVKENIADRILKDARGVLVLENNDRQYQSIKSTYISLPIDIKFSAERFNNYRPYAMVGVNPMLDLTVKRQQQLLLKKFDCYLEAGFGCDFYWPWFKFSPEIKFCYGLLNIIDKNRDDMTDASQLIFSESIDKGRSKMIVFTLYFE